LGEVRGGVSGEGLSRGETRQTCPKGDRAEVERKKHEIPQKKGGGGSRKEQQSIGTRGVGGANIGFSTNKCRGRKGGRGGGRGGMEIVRGNRTDQGGKFGRGVNWGARKTTEKANGGWGRTRRKGPKGKKRRSTWARIET